MRHPALKAAPRSRRRISLCVLALAALFLLAGCATGQDGVDSPQNNAPVVSASVATQAPSSDVAASQPAAAPEPAARTFTTPEGAYSFDHPVEWIVTEDSSQDGVYVVRREDGQVVAWLATGRPVGPLASPVYPLTTQVSADVPGLADPLGRTVTAVVGLFPGQSVGGEAIAYGLADGGDPAANYGRVRSADASFLSFGGIRPIGDGSAMLSQDEIHREMTAYTASAEGRSVLAMLSSLTVDTSVTGSVCRDGNYVYTELQGVGCLEAQRIVGEVRSDGHAEGAHSVGSDRYFCASEGVEPSEFPDPMYVCGPRGASDVQFHLDPITMTGSHPLRSIEADSFGQSAEDAMEAAVDCVGVNYEFTEVDGLTCTEAKGMLQPFHEGQGTPADQNAQVVGDTACTRAPAERGGATVTSWSCSRTEGGSFVAYARM